MGKIKSYTSSSGMKTVHYDENDNKTGVNYRSPAGHVTHYDSSGSKNGHSYIHSSAPIKYYNTNYNKTGKTWGSGFGYTTQSEYHTSRSSPSDTSTGCSTLLFLAGICILL